MDLVGPFAVQDLCCSPNASAKPGKSNINRNSIEDSYEPRSQ